MANVKIKNIHGKTKIYRNRTYFTLKDADDPNVEHIFSCKEGTINVGTTGVTDVTEFANVNVTVEEYTNELKAEMEDNYDIIGNLVDTIIAIEEGYLNEDNNAETDS